MSTVLECRELTAGYSHRTVIENVSFQLAAGEMAGLLGPNGAGKTTLFRTLTGLLPVTAGNVFLFSRHLNHYSAPERARLIGVVPQELDTPMPFLVEEIVMMGRTATLNRWRSPGDRDRQAVEQALQAADALRLRDRIFGELSGGEKQRCIIAMALAQEPEILLLDEATSHLDLHHRLEILELLQRLNRERGMTILMTSHDLNLAARFCRRLLLLENGRLAADGPPAEVIQEELLSRIFRCELRVRPDPDSGLPAVFPIRSLNTSPTP